MKKPPIHLWPVYAFWLLQRRGRFAWWRLLNRLGFARFRSIGRGVRFNGWVRVEKPGMDIVVGPGCMIGKGCYFLATPEGKIELGEDVGVNDHCYITSNYGIRIGAHTRIAEFVSIRDYDHEFTRTDVPMCEQGFRGGPIEIGEDCWVGRGVMITGDVRIGRGCVIGANAVVTKDIPDWSVAVGVPAKVIKTRNSGQAW